MLALEVPGIELYDERTKKFIEIEPQLLELEHSLVSLSKWESEWCIPFLGKGERTNEQIIDYIRCMNLRDDTDPRVFEHMPPSILSRINQYISAPMTATTFSDNGKAPTGRGETITSELVYYWMVALAIPFECQNWHLHRLITLIKVCNVKNSPPKKMSRSEIMSRNKALNASRRKSLGTSG